METRDPVRCAAQMLARQKQLADTKILRYPDHFRKEGKLPNGDYFYAIKAGNLRAYGWFHAGQFVISHYVYKKRQKLDKADTNRVCANWHNFQE